MKITPTNPKKANRMATKVVVYDTLKKKPVLVFKARNLCAEYLYGHRIFSICDKTRFGGSIRYWVENKLTNEENIFAKSLAFRSPNQEMIELLGDNDFVVLDEEYRLEEFEEKHNSKPAAGGIKRKYDEYVLENILGIGDEVEIIFGRLAGYTTKILDVKGKRLNTPGTKLYSLNIHGTVHDYKSNVLKLIKKAE